MKKLGLVFAAAIAALSINASASAGNGDYPPEGAILILDPSTVAAGGTVTATFIGCSVGETVTFTFNPTVSATCVATTGEPAATTTFTAPATAGDFPVVAVGLTSGAGATGILTVTAAPGAPAPGAPAPGAPAAPGGGLPATGSDSAPTMQIAGGLVAVGAGLALVGGLRRRKLAAI